MPMTSLQNITKHFPQLSNIEEIKIGGQKCVYSAFHAEYGDIALKIVLTDGDDDRILREIEIIKNNSFPNVPAIYECGDVNFDGKTYIYIYEQKITGTDLRDIIQSGYRFPFIEVLQLLNNLFETVVKLEKQSIVHRDIKPDNILRDEAGRFWLIDFGIARDLKKISLTATGANFGPHTAGYAAPEQFRNMKRQIDSRTDLFSIGVVAYELLYGVNPFVSGAHSFIDVLLKTETLTEDPLSIPEDTDGELSGFIQTLMQKGHTWRPPSAAIAYSWFNEIMNKLGLEAN